MIGDSVSHTGGCYFSRIEKLEQEREEFEDILKRTKSQLKHEKREWKKKHPFSSATMELRDEQLNMCGL